jgi:2-phospho-L-lactate guanylyltransferase
MARQILIPCKSLAQGKSRLGAILTCEQRENLCTEFLLNTLQIARALVPPNHISVISSDIWVHATVRANGAETIEDAGQGFSAAVSFARDSLIKMNSTVTQLLILPIDLPLATASAVDDLFHLNADVAIAPDASESGTNLLCLAADAVANFRFCYGPNSFQSHCRQAREKNLVLAIMRDRGIALDIDMPGDYVAWKRSVSAQTELTKKPLVRCENKYGTF